MIAQNPNVKRDKLTEDFAEKAKKITALADQWATQDEQKEIAKQILEKHPGGNMQDASLGVELGLMTAKDEQRINYATQAKKEEPENKGREQVDRQQIIDNMVDKTRQPAGV